ncbi:MAG: hypothetical protein NWS40_00610 [Crocinitomicaceae bacterium]|nr:hypothetical protein [Crocinitomicaceae bacterium]
MKNIFRSYSFLAVLLGLILAVTARVSYFSNNSTNGYNATTWDALGYYMYLPGVFIYQDVKELKWLPKVDSKYQVSGGSLYQANQLENGNFAFKYLAGVAILELPFFAIGHLCAYLSGEPMDGFSWPYQYAILWGAIFWFFLGLLVLRKVLLQYYSESITTLTLLLLVFGTNLIQYVSVDGAMSHSYIFPLYAFVLWWTIRWHETFSRKYAFLIGLTIGIATISRPTELIMLFIPLLWSLDNSGKLAEKWKMTRLHYSHVFIAISGGIIGILPQLIYWKHATGSWIYDVGSKWNFLNPWWRVLFGFEKGWFVYTPITIFMILGLFFIKTKPFRKAIIVFIILNLWIILSWSDWRYGASYSVRALIQSYPIFALALAAFLDYFYKRKVRYLIVFMGVLLCSVNLIQIEQYNSTVLHYDHMNRKYYAAIFLNTRPEPLDYSLLDTDEQLPNDLLEQSNVNSKTFQQKEVSADLTKSTIIGSLHIKNETWLATKCQFTSSLGLKSGNLAVLAFKDGKVLKEKHFRFAIPFAADQINMSYENHFSVPEKSDSVIWKIESFDHIKIPLLTLTIKQYVR